VVRCMTPPIEGVVGSMGSEVRMKSEKAKEEKREEKINQSSQKVASPPLGPPSPTLSHIMHLRVSAVPNR
jgi:hypothetical protein